MLPSGRCASGCGGPSRSTAAVASVLGSDRDARNHQPRASNPRPRFSARSASSENCVMAFSDVSKSVYRLLRPIDASLATTQLRRTIQSP